MNTLIRQINETAVKPDSICLWWIGQEGFVIKSQNLILYIDPYLSTYAERITKGHPNEHVRMCPPPMTPAEVTNADIVLCTHDHADHIDPDGIPLIAESSPRVHFVVPAAARQTMLNFRIDANRIHTLKGDDHLILRDIKVYGICAKHERFDRDPQKGCPYLSYIIQIEGQTLLHAGDTIPYAGQVEKVNKHKIDLAFIPINGRDDFRHSLQFEGNFTCDEAVDFARAIRAGLTIPMHYDMFTINTADVNDFRKIAARKNLRYLVMEHAQSIRFPWENKND